MFGLVIAFTSPTPCMDIRVQRQHSLIWQALQRTSQAQARRELEVQTATLWSELTFADQRAREVEVYANAARQGAKLQELSAVETESEVLVEQANRHRSAMAALEADAEN